jgi:hypothetical protein
MVSTEPGLAQGAGHGCGPCGCGFGVEGHPEVPKVALCLELELQVVENGAL